MRARQDDLTAPSWCAGSRRSFQPGPAAAMCILRSDHLRACAFFAAGHWLRGWSAKGVGNSSCSRNRTLLRLYQAQSHVSCHPTPLPHIYICMEYLMPAHKALQSSRCSHGANPNLASQCQVCECNVKHMRSIQESPRTKNLHEPSPVWSCCISQLSDSAFTWQLAGVQVIKCRQGLRACMQMRGRVRQLVAETCLCQHITGVGERGLRPAAHFR